VTSGIGAVSFETIHLPTTGESLFFLLLFGFFNFAAFNLMNKGFTTIPASTGTMVMMIEPIIGALLGFLFYKEIPTPIFLAGAMILFLAVYIAVFKPSKLRF
jgi:drug/metabolite transporter (DMT)-like permease